MNVLMISPGYPTEMPSFTKALAQIGIRVFGIGDQPPESLPGIVKGALSDYLQVPSLWNEKEVVQAVHRWKGVATIQRVECLWEPAMILAARLREAFGISGLNVAQTIPFRDKEVMKQMLDRANLRTPRHFLAKSTAECWKAADELGFPLILKPVSGAGSADTYRVNDQNELRAVLPKLSHIPEVSVEEFIDGEEFTFDAICADGQVAYYNIAWYRPRPLIARSNQWISPQVIALKQVDQAELRDGVQLGHDVIQTLGFQNGFAHMEWYRKPDGDVVFGEIGARPPGAHQVDQMNYACDIDAYKEWARAVCFSKFDAQVVRKYNVATIYKRAQGQGRITSWQGRDLLQKYREHIVWNSLLPVGAERRNWHHTLISDGFVMLRHPDLDQTLAMADEIGSQLTLFAQ